MAGKVKEKEEEEAEKVVPEQQVGSAGSSGEGEGESGADERRQCQVDSREVRKKTLFYTCMNESRTTTP